MTSTGYWSVAQCETRRESTAARFLHDQGFVTYLPKIKIAHKRIVPLFPSYLFVRIVDRWLFRCLQPAIPQRMCAITWSS
jgi:Transcription termination factor nusG